MCKYDVIKYLIFMHGKEMLECVGDKHIYFSVTGYLIMSLLQRTCPSWESNNGSVYQEIPLPLCPSRVHGLIQKRPSLVCILNLMNRVVVPCFSPVCDRNFIWLCYVPSAWCIALPPNGPSFCDLSILVNIQNILPPHSQPYVPGCDMNVGN